MGKDFATKLTNALFALRLFKEDANLRKGHFLPKVGFRVRKGKAYIGVIVGAGDQVAVITMDGKRYAFAESAAVRDVLTDLVVRAFTQGARRRK
jgi:hypothetical protein